MDNSIEPKTNLKPCPFCGSDNIELTRNTYEGCVDYDAVHCCICSGQTEGESKEEAIKLWNTRAPALPSKPSELVELANKLTYSQISALQHAKDQHWFNFAFLVGLNSEMTKTIGCLDLDKLSPPTMESVASAIRKEGL